MCYEKGDYDLFANICSQEVECIMLNDNLISVFGNFPLMPKVKDIEISHNRITRIEPNMHLHLPSLTDLNLDHNRIAELSELDNLAGFTKLKCLVFKYNPICENEVRTQYLLLF